MKGAGAQSEGGRIRLHPHLPNYYAHNWNDLVSTFSHELFHEVQQVQARHGLRGEAMSVYDRELAADVFAAEVLNDIGVASVYSSSVTLAIRLRAWESLSGQREVMRLIMDKQNAVWREQELQRINCKR